MNWLRCMSITIKENGIHELWMSQQLVLSIQFEILRLKGWRHKTFFSLFFTQLLVAKFTRDSAAGISLWRSNPWVTLLATDLCNGYKLVSEIFLEQKLTVRFEERIELSSNVAALYTTLPIGKSLNRTRF